MNRLLPLLLLVLLATGCKKNNDTKPAGNSGSNKDTTTKFDTFKTFFVRNTSGDTYYVDVYASYTDYGLNRKKVDSFVLAPGKSFSYYERNLYGGRRYIDCYTAGYLHSNWYLDSNSKILNNGRDTLFALNYDESDARNTLLKGNGISTEWETVDVYKYDGTRYYSIGDTMKGYKFSLSFYKDFLGYDQVCDSDGLPIQGASFSMRYGIVPKADKRFEISCYDLTPPYGNPGASYTVYSHWSPATWSSSATSSDTLMMEKFGMYYLLKRK